MAAVMCYVAGPLLFLWPVSKNIRKDKDAVFRLNLAMFFAQSVWLTDWLLLQQPSLSSSQPTSNQPATDQLMGSHLFDYPIRRTHTLLQLWLWRFFEGRRNRFPLSYAIVRALSFFLFLARFGIAIILITLDLIPFPSPPSSTAVATLATIENVATAEKKKREGNEKKKIGEKNRFPTNRGVREREREGEPFLVQLQSSTEKCCCTVAVALFLGGGNRLLSFPFAIFISAFRFLPLNFFRLVFRALATAAAAVLYSIKIH